MSTTTTTAIETDLAIEWRVADVPVEAGSILDPLCRILLSLARPDEATSNDQEPTDKPIAGADIVEFMRTHGNGESQK